MKLSQFSEAPHITEADQGMLTDQNVELHPVNPLLGSVLRMGHEEIFGWRGDYDQVPDDGRDLVAVSVDWLIDELLEQPQERGITTFEKAQLEHAKHDDRMPTELTYHELTPEQQGAASEFAELLRELTEEDFRSKGGSVWLELVYRAERSIRQPRRASQEYSGKKGDGLLYIASDKGGVIIDGVLYRVDPNIAVKHDHSITAVTADLDRGESIKRLHAFTNTHSTK